MIINCLPLLLSIYWLLSLSKGHLSNVTTICYQIGRPDNPGWYKISVHWYCICTMILARHIKVPQYEYFHAALILIIYKNKNIYMQISWHRFTNQQDPVCIKVEIIFDQWDTQWAYCPHIPHHIFTPNAIQSQYRRSTPDNTRLLYQPVTGHWV